MVQGELIMQRTKCHERYYQGGGDGRLCADALGREVFADSVALLGGKRCDVPVMAVHPGDHTMSSGVTTALWLLRTFPASSIVCAGFDQHKTDKETGKRTPHAWDFEGQQLLPAMQRTGLLHVVNTEEAALSVHRRVGREDQ